MLNARINTRKIWYALCEGWTDEADQNGDFTGERAKTFGKVKMTRANLSPSRGTSEEDYFGQDLQYSNTLSTAKMNLGIDERTILWDEKPEMNLDKAPADPKSAKYRVVAIARGHYQVHYALRQMDRSEDDEA